MNALLLLFATAAAEPAVARAIRIDQPPTIDGRITEESWQAAPVIEQFTQKTPVDGAAPSEPTRLYVMYDDEALYVAFDCTQERSAIVSRVARRDSPVPADSVSFNVGSRGDGRSAFEFSVNVAGSKSDALYYNDTDYASEWDESWEVATTLTERGWSVEFKVPLRVLRFGPAREQVWDFQARRYIAERQEYVEWRHIPKNQGGEVSQYGKLVGIERLTGDLHWEVRPFMLARLRRIGDVPGAPARVEPGNAVGGDFKYQASRGLTLDATFNPDFAQIEADQQLLNLSNVETYYPEKRAFFLEGTDIFATPLQLLYTRRIGSSIETYDLDTDALGGELASVPDPAPIYGAMKLTGKLGEDWTIGTLQALTAPAEVHVVTGPGQRRSRTIAPVSAFNVLRARRDLDGGTYVGATLTGVKRLEPRTGLRFVDDEDRGTGKLCPSGDVVAEHERCFNDAYVASLDWRWRSPEGDWISVGQLTGSMLRGGPARHVDDGTVIRPGDMGHGALVKVAKQAGSDVLGQAWFEYAGRRLDYTDLGYSEGSNRYRIGAEVFYQVPTPRSPLREMTYQLEHYSDLNLDGLTTENVTALVLSSVFVNGWQHMGEVFVRTRRYDDREVGNGLALERAANVGVVLELSSDDSRMFSAGLSTASQWFETGASFDGQLELALHPSPELAIELTPALGYTLGEPRFASEGTAPGEYLFGKLKAKSVSTELRLSYAFLPSLSLTAYGQAFLASGHYSSLSVFREQAGSRKVRLDALEPYQGSQPYNPDFMEGALNFTLVFHWEYSVGATLYGVYTHSQELSTGLPLGRSAGLDWSSLGDARRVDTILLKLGYWWGN